MLTHDGGGWRAAAPPALVGGAVAVLLALAPGVGWADDGLSSSDPADGAALPAAPQAVVLTFTATPDPDLSHVSVRDASGASVVRGEAVRAGRLGLRLVVSIRSRGDYTVAYHAVLDGGAEAVGALRFSVGTGVAPQPLSADAARVAQQAAAGHDNTIDPLSGSLLVIDAVVLAGVVVLLQLRPRPRDSDELFGNARRPYSRDGDRVR